MNPERQIGGVEFDGDRVTISYLTPSADIRNKGLVMATHQLVVLRCPDYADEIEALQEAATELLNDALEDWENSEPIPLAPEIDEEDDDDE